MNESLQKMPASSLTVGQRLKNMALFLLSPFIALYYAVLLPGKLIQLARAERLAAPSSPTTVERR